MAQSGLTLSSYQLLILRRLVHDEVWKAKGRTVDADADVDQEYLSEVSALYDSILKLSKHVGLKWDISIDGWEPKPPEFGEPVRF